MIRESHSCSMDAYRNFVISHWRLFSGIFFPLVSLSHRVRLTRGFLVRRTKFLDQKYTNDSGALSQRLEGAASWHLCGILVAYFPRNAGQHISSVHMPSSHRRTKLSLLVVNWVWSHRCIFLPFDYILLNSLLLFDQYQYQKEKRTTGQNW